MADEFIALCTALRKLGATHVKHGAFEASFAAGMPREADARPAPQALTEKQRKAEIEALRRDELSRV